MDANDARSHRQIHIDYIYKKTNTQTLEHITAYFSCCAQHQQSKSDRATWYYNYICTSPGQQSIDDKSKNALMPTAIISRIIRPELSTTPDNLPSNLNTSHLPNFTL